MDCGLAGSSGLEFSRQQSWGRLPCPPPGDFSNPGIEPESPAAGFISRQILYHWAIGKAQPLYRYGNLVFQFFRKCSSDHTNICNGICPFFVKLILKYLQTFTKYQKIFRILILKLQHCMSRYFQFICLSATSLFYRPFEMEQDPMVFPLHVLSLPFVCGKTQAKSRFNQRSEKIQKERKTVKVDQMISCGNNCVINTNNCIDN